MVELVAVELDLIFHALADATRREIVNMLATRKLTVSEVAKPFRMSLAAVSKHLKVLERAGLIHREQQGTSYWLSLNAEALMTAEQWLKHYEQFWDKRLDSLKQFLEQDKK